MASLPSPLVDVMVTGSLLQGHDRETVTQQLSRLINRDAATAGMLLSGTPVRIKSAVDASTGSRYVGALEAIGVAARIIPVTLDVDLPDDSPSTVADEARVSLSEAAASGATQSPLPTETPDSEVDSMKRWSSVPNLLFFVLVVTALFSRLHAHGVSPFALRGAAYAYGEATAFFILPLIVGASWNFLRGERPLLLWTYVCSTAFLLLILIIGTYAQAPG